MNENDLVDTIYVEMQKIPRSKSFERVEAAQDTIAKVKKPETSRRKLLEEAVAYKQTINN